jgi:O-antigen/teichoic acid export membrane protein
MGIALFTSRILLKALGFVDYGLYNVVAGVITLFSYLNTSLGAATSRFFTYELGTDNIDKLKTVFRTAVNIHLSLALIIVVFCESIGLWIVNNVLSIPAERIIVCNIVYQFVIISSVFSIMQVPFNAMVIAHEKMKVFACICVANAVLQLGVAYFVLIANYDNLIIYGLLSMLAVIAIYAYYHYYCKKNLDGYDTGLRMDKTLLKEMVSFSGWSLLGNTANMASISITNILMNMFFGPLVNAANAVAQQVNGAVNTFYTNFTMALKPQIVKTYAGGEMLQMKKLLFRGGKFSFFLLMFFLIPVLLEADIILKLWLKDVPGETGAFMKLMLIYSLLSCFGTTISVAIQATGKIKYYQIVIGITLLLTFPLTYALYKFEYPPAVVFYTMMIMVSIATVERLFFLKRYLNIACMDYFKNVILVSCAVFILSVILPALVHQFMSEGFFRLTLVSCISFFSSGLFIYLTGLSKTEKIRVNILINKVVRRTRHICLVFFLTIYYSLKIIYLKLRNKKSIVISSSISPILKNWGDDVSTTIVNLINPKLITIPRKYLFYNNHKTDYLCIGSIITWLITPQSTVWGSGVKSSEDEIRYNNKNVRPYKVLAVRGPLTREYLLARGIECPEIYGDPALLFPRYYTPKFEKKYKYGIIPHFRDKNNAQVKHLAEKIKEFHLIDVQDVCNWQTFIDEITSCEFIFSSSLHGIIVSDAYSIPNCWVEFGEKKRFPFRDYFLSVGKNIDNPVTFENFSINDVTVLRDSWQPPIIDLDKLMSVCPFKNV